MRGPHPSLEPASERIAVEPSIRKEVALAPSSPAAIQARWSAALDPTAEALRHLRVGAGILLAVQFLNIAADMYAKPGFASRFAGLHLLDGALLAAMVGLTWTRLLQLYWRWCAMAACAILLATGTWMSIVSHDVLPRFVGVLVFALGCATFLPWGGLFQAALNFLCLLSFVLDAVYVGGLPKEGTYLWVGVFTALILAQFIAIYSERYRLALVMSAEELAHRDAAIESSRLKSLFLATVSHEMRTPLHIIQTYSVVIGNQLRKSGATGGSALRGIQRAGRRLQQIIDHTLDFSRLEAGEFQVKPASLDLVVVIGASVDSFRPLAEEHGLKLSWEPSMPEAIVMFDEYCLKQTMSNLLDNAIKFTERGSIVVRLFRDSSNQVCLEIRDTGVGIDPEFIPRMFEPFSQEQLEYSKRFTGAGLGLALVKRYLTLNSAQITVATDKGVGTSVLIQFATGSANPPDRV